MPTKFLLPLLMLMTVPAASASLKVGGVTSRTLNGQSRMGVALELGHSVDDFDLLESDGSLSQNALESILIRELPALKNSRALAQIAVRLKTNYNAYQMTNAAGKDTSVSLSPTEIRSFLNEAGLAVEENSALLNGTVALLTL